MTRTTDTRLGRTFAYYAALTAMGLEGAALGPTLPALAEQTGTLLSGISFLFAARGGGYLLGCLLGGRLFDRLTGHPVLGLVLFAMGAGLCAVPFVPWIAVLAAVLFVVGVGEGVLDVGSNTLLMWNHPVNLAPYMNGLHFAFGVGAFVSPIVVAKAIAASGGIAWAYWAFGVSMAPVAVVILRLPSPRPKEMPQTSANGGGQGVLIFLIAACFFAFVGAEVGLGGWIYTYATTLHLADAAGAAYLTSTFWGAFTFGRMTAIVIATRVRPQAMLAGNLLGAVASVSLVLAFPANVDVLWAGTAGAGFFIAPLFATMLAFAEPRLAMTGRVTGWFFVGSSLGAMTLPWLIGQFFESTGPRVTMGMTLADLVGALALFVALLLYARRAHLADRSSMNQEVLHG